jgi:hypothetical protein
MSISLLRKSSTLDEDFNKIGDRTLLTKPALETFNENLQIAHSNRKADMLKAKSRGDIKKGYNTHAHPSDNLTFDLEDVR